MVSFLWAYCHLASVTSHWWSWAVGSPSWWLLCVPSGSAGRWLSLNSSFWKLGSDCTQPLQLSLQPLEGCRQLEIAVHSAHLCLMLVVRQLTPGWVPECWQAELLSGADYLLWYLCLNGCLPGTRMKWIGNVTVCKRHYSLSEICKIPRTFEILTDFQTASESGLLPGGIQILT